MSKSECKHIILRCPRFRPQALSISHCARASRHATPCTHTNQANKNMAQHLAPMPRPGLPLYPGFRAERPETFLFKGRDLWSNKASFLISHATPDGEAVAPFLELKEESKNNIIFRTLDGMEVMRIIRNSPTWSGKGAKYYGMRGPEEVWQLRLMRGVTGTDYGMVCMQLEKVRTTNHGCRT